MPMPELNLIRKLIIGENRRILGEAIITLAMGLGTIILVFGGVFWISWLAFTMMLGSFAIGSPATTALIITGVFALISIWSAWRKHDPISNVQAMDENLH